MLAINFVLAVAEVALNLNQQSETLCNQSEASYLKGRSQNQNA